MGGWARTRAAAGRLLARWTWKFACSAQQGQSLAPTFCCQPTPPLSRRLAQVSEARLIELLEQVSEQTEKKTKVGRLL